MLLRTWRTAIQIAFTLIGTIVGAGFASGQEIYLFFSQFGQVGTLMLFFTCVGFIWFSQRVLLFANCHQLTSPYSFFHRLFGPIFAARANLLLLISLFAISCVMLAGASAALQAIFNFPYWLAGGMTLLLIAFVLRRQLNGLYLVNNLVVPILIGCMIVLCFLTGERNIQLFKPIAVAFPTVRAVFYAFAYVALNLTLAKPILLAVGATNDRRALTHGAWLAGIGIGILLFCSDYLLQHAIVRPDQLQIPIAAHAMTVSNKLGYVYYWLIYFEIVTTLLANLYSVHIQLTETQRIPTKALIPALLLLCLLLGQFGFAHLLHLIYPIIGVLGLVWLITFAVRT